jgi:NADPH:quinone reductase-like Zn-dependent oxidoreductase
MDQKLPQTLGYEAAGLVDEIGDDVSGVTVGDRVFGASPYGAAQAELAVLSYWAPIPDSLDHARSAAIPAAAETAARSLEPVVRGRRQAPE